jgi:hypothetical protein
VFVVPSVLCNEEKKRRPWFVEKVRKHTHTHLYTHNTPTHNYYNTLPIVALGEEFVHVEEGVALSVGQLER